MRPYTDIITGGWVSRLPPEWLPYALLARVDRPIGTWLLFLPGLFQRGDALAQTAQFREELFPGEMIAGVPWQSHR